VRGCQRRCKVDVLGGDGFILFYLFIFFVRLDDVDL